MSQTGVKIYLVLLISLCLLQGALAYMATPPPVPISSALLTATDDLGRTLPTAAEVGPPRPNRWVGLFFFQWHANLRCWEYYDVTRWLKWHPYFSDWKAFRKGWPAHPTWYWAEPIFGYYRSDDPWVLRRQLALIAQAGVDFLYFDYTNALVYDHELQTLLKVRSELEAQGLVMPRLVFFLNFRPYKKAEHLYLEYYKRPELRDCWFYWQGKPLIMAPKPTEPSQLEHPGLLKELQDYFTWRPTWAFFDSAKYPHKWRFEDYTPQRPALGPDGKIEQMVVSKALGAPIWNNMDIGSVSCTPGHVPTYDSQWLSKDVAKGLFFAKQWEIARKVAAPILLVTGWNEWTASVWEQPGVVFLRHKTTKGEGYFVDEFNQEFDRDLEPMKGGYGDAYYCQFLAEMRRYKGMLPAPEASAPRTIAIDGKFDDWGGVKPLYLDVAGDTAPRNWAGNPPDTHYAVTSGRNDFTLCQVAYDARHVYFHARCAAPLTRPAGRNWLLLLVDSDANPRTGWRGYDYLVNSTRKPGFCSLQRNVENQWRWHTVQGVPLAWSGCDLELALPRALFGESARPLRFAFKWLDNLPPSPTLYDLYNEGDCAPDGRFSYLFDS